MTRLGMGQALIGSAGDRCGTINRCAAPGRRGSGHRRRHLIGEIEAAEEEAALWIRRTSRNRRGLSTARPPYRAEMSTRGRSSRRKGPPRKNGGAAKAAGDGGDESGDWGVREEL